MDVILSKIYNKNRIKRYINFFIGALICAISYNLFILPYNIVFGGVGGISIIVSNFITIKPSVFIFVCCMILCVVSFIVLSPKKTIGSLIGGIVFPILVELTSNIGNYINVDGNDMLLFTVFGGITYGIGLGLIMKADFTLGGTDIITQIVSKYTKMTIGNAMLIVEGVIVIIGAFVFGVTNFMYAVVILYLITFLVDKVLLGISDKKAFYIITKKKKEVYDFVINELGHTITVFNATGGFSRKKVSVLFTVIPTKEYYKLKEGIKHIDIEAFFTVVDAYEVTGGE